MKRSRNCAVWCGGICPRPSISSGFKVLAWTHLIWKYFGLALLLGLRKRIWSLSNLLWHLSHFPGFLVRSGKDATQAGFP